MLSPWSAVKARRASDRGVDERAQSGVEVRDLLVVAVDIEEGILDTGFGLIGEDALLLDRHCALVVEGDRRAVRWPVGAMGVDVVHPEQQWPLGVPGLLEPLECCGGGSLAASLVDGAIGLLLVDEVVVVVESPGNADGLVGEDRFDRCREAGPGATAPRPG
jgi:hypothetical protein